MKRGSVFLLVLLLTMFFHSGTALAIPSLQLYIEDGEYNWSDETWVIYPETGPFTLTAFAMDKHILEGSEGNAFYGTDKTAFLVAALTPKFDEGDSPTDIFGTLQIDGASYSSWTWGPDTIPDPDSFTDIDDYNNLTDAGLTGLEQLSPHGIFNTYFVTHQFSFTDQTDYVFDTQYPDGYKSGWQKDFSIVLSNLNIELFEGVHFDLYTQDASGALHKFAPFSHDAEAFPIPEPTTMLLLGSGLIGLAGFRRKFRKK